MTTIAWDEIEAERDPERKVALMVDAGLLRRTGEGEVELSDGARSVVEPFLQSAPVLRMTHVAVSVECYHRETVLNEREMEYVDAEELAGMLRFVSDAMKQRRRG